MSNTRLGLVRCEHCGRQFNPHSGARHIPWCEKQQNENRKRRLSVEKRQALERYKWRIGYRPTNQLPTSNNQQHSQEQRRFNIVTNFNKLKKSSTNSSATLSSPSASSTNSVTSSANNDIQSSKLKRQRNQFEKHSTNLRQQHQSGPTKRSNQSGVRQAPVAQLKRSISSLTLTKQQGICSSADSNKTKLIPTAKSSFAPLSWQKTTLNREGSSLSGKSDATFAKTSDQANKQHRTKSVNDLSNMSEIVETLAKRMDAIYAQNQALLASLSRGNLKKQLITRNRSSLLSSDDEDREAEVEGEDDDGDDLHEDAADLEELNGGQISCHHCKASCMKQANYCHKCGCKVYCTTTNSTVTMSSESPG